MQAFDQRAVFGLRVADDDVVVCDEEYVHNFAFRGEGFARARSAENQAVRVFQEFSINHDEVFLGRDLGKGKNYSEEVAFEIDKEIRKLIDEGYNKAEKLLSQNMNRLRAVAEKLLEKEKLEADEFEEVFAQA